MKSGLKSGLKLRLEVGGLRLEVGWGLLKAHSVERVSESFVI